MAKTKKTIKKSTFTLKDIPDLLRSLGNPELDRKAALKAAKGLYELSDVDHKSNRVVMAKSTDYNVVEVVCGGVNSQGNNDIRHLCLLVLNNLSIPQEAKEVLAKGGDAKLIFDTCTDTINNDPQEAYLAAICLMNLSFLTEIVPEMLTGGNAEGDIKGKDALLPIITRVVSHGNSEAARWCCGLMKNISKTPQGAMAICDSELPNVLFDFMRIDHVDADDISAAWLSNSIEDFVLYVFLYISQCKTMRDGMITDSLGALSPLTSDSGIQGLKAILTVSILGDDVTPKQASRVTEVVVNVMNKSGKTGEYAYGVFNMNTALSAMSSLAVNSRINGDQAYMDAIASPAGIASLFQIIADMIIAEGSGPSTSDTSKDSSSPEDSLVSMSVSSLLALSPSIYRGVGSVNDAPSENTIKAKNEVASMIRKFADLKKFPADSPTTTEAEQFLSATESVPNHAPRLEHAYDIWVSRREADGINYGLFFAGDNVEVDESGPLDFLPCEVPKTCIIL